MPDCEMPEKQIICAWYSNKMSINKLFAPNSNICLIRLCAWFNYILFIWSKHFLISSFCFQFILSQPSQQYSVNWVADDYLDSVQMFWYDLWNIVKMRTCLNLSKNISASHDGLCKASLLKSSSLGNPSNTMLRNFV